MMVSFNYYFRTWSEGVNGLRKDNISKLVSLHDRWVVERQNEYYYKLAKKLNYRSRASFKLMQIDDRFGIFEKGDSVVDLGACPVAGFRSLRSVSEMARWSALTSGT